MIFPTMVFVNNGFGGPSDNHPVPVIGFRLFFRQSANAVELWYQCNKPGCDHVIKAYRVDAMRRHLRDHITGMTP